MLMGILSDTRNMTYNVTQLDNEAYETLLPITGIEDIGALYEGMSNAKTSYDDMTTEEIFNSKYKEYTAGAYHFGIGFVYASSETIAEVSAEMKQYMQEIYPQSGQDYLFSWYQTATAHGCPLSEKARKSWPVNVMRNTMAVNI